MRRTAAVCWLLGCLVLFGAASGDEAADGEVRLALEFRDAELSRIVEAVSVAVGRRFLFDSGLQGRITIKVPGLVTVPESLEILNAALLLKGYTMVPGPHDFWKIVPVGAASGQMPWIDRLPHEHDQGLAVTMVRLESAGAEEIAALLQPFVAESGLVIAYAPANSLILGGTEARMRRLIEIAREIDSGVQSEVVVLHLHHRSADRISEIVREIFGESPVPVWQVDVWPNDFANSLILRGPPALLAEIRDFVRQLDVRHLGRPDIHVYRVQHADAKDLAEILNSILSGARSSPGGRGSRRLQRSAIADVTDPITVTADSRTNSLLVQASGATYETLLEVLQQLDIRRPQVLVRAVIMEVDVGDSFLFGVEFVTKYAQEEWGIALASLSDAVTTAVADSDGGSATSSDQRAMPFLASVNKESSDGDSVIRAVLRAAASDGRINLVSAPHMLILDNEEAEIHVGDNVPIITSRVQTPVSGAQNDVTTSVGVERQDIGVRLRVTPQIGEGDALQLGILEEISNVDPVLSLETGGDADLGPAFTNRKIESTVTVTDGETVVIASGLRGRVRETVIKVPFLGDIPILGWLFRTEERSLYNSSLLVFVSVQIVRNPGDLAEETIRLSEEIEAQARKN